MFERYIQQLTSPKLSLTLIGLMFCLPFVLPYHDIPIAVFYEEWLAAVLGLFAFTGLLNKQNLQSLKLPAISLVFIGLMLICSVQWISGLLFSFKYTLLIQGYLFWAFLMTVLGHYLRRTVGWKKLINVLAAALIIAAAINAGFIVLQVLQRLGYEMPIPKLPSYGMLAQSNNFADFVGLAIVSLFYFYAKQRIRIQTLGISLLCGLLMLSFSGSRSSVLYLLIIISLSFLLYLKFKRDGRQVSVSKNLLTLSLSLLPLFILLQAILISYLPIALIETPASRAMEAFSAQSTSLRWEFWQTSLNLFSQSPWLGIGAGQTRWHTYLLINEPTVNTAQIFFEHSHNLFLHLLAEMGVLAILVLSIGIAFWLKEFLKNQSFSFETWWVLGILAIISVHSMLEYPLWYSYFLGIFAFLLGAGDFKTLDLQRLSASAQRLLKLTCILAILYGAQQLYVMQVAYQKLEKQIAIASLPEMSDTQKKVFVEDMIWINENTLLAPYAELILATYINPDVKQKDIQIKIVEDALKFIPLHKPVLNYVILLEITGSHQDAIDHLKRLLRISGGNLKADIQQLPRENQFMLHKLMDEII